MDIEDVLVALLAVGAHEHPAAARHRDSAGDVCKHVVQIVPRRDLTVPDHFELHDAHVGSEPRLVRERSGCRQLQRIAGLGCSDA